jgi:hypothetical protein
MSEPQTSDPHGGLSASGRTADQMGPDETESINDYGNTGQEVVTDPDDPDVDAGERPGQS